MIITYFMLMGVLFAAGMLPAQTRHTDLQPGKMGFLGTKGDTIVPVEYDFLPWKYAPRMMARKGELRGVIGAAGYPLVPLDYQDIRFEKNGFFAVAKKHIRRTVWGLLNPKGEMVLEIQYDFVAVLSNELLAARLVNNRVSIYDAKGKLLFKTEGEEAMPGFEGRSVLIRKADRSTYWVDLEGNAIAPPLFENTIWSDGAYFIAIQNNWHGVLNAQGETVVPFRFRGIEPRNKGHFAVVDAEYKPLLIDSRGKTLVKGECIRLGQEEGDVYFKRGATEYAGILYDATGKKLFGNCAVYPVITQAQWNKLSENHYDRYSWVELKKDKLKAFYRADGMQILPPLFKKIDYCTDRHPLIGFILDKKKGKYDAGLYDFQGKPLMKQRFADINFTEDPRIVIAKLTPDGLWGVVDLREPEKAEYLYSRIEYHPEGRYTGVRDGEEVALFDNDEEEENELYNLHDVQTEPSFPVGQQALNAYIATNLKYPPIAAENGVQGQVVIRFIIENDGRITSAFILRDIGGGCGQEALRLVQNMPNWEPAIRDGQPVRVQYTLPVRFKLE